MNIFLIFLSFFALTVVNGAFVESYACGDADVKSFQFSDFITDVYYEPENDTLKFQLYAYTLRDIIDVNSTTNRFTTLQVQMDFMGESEVSEYLRFCDYLEIVNSTGSDSGTASLTSLTSSSTSSTDLSSTTAIAAPPEKRYDAALPQQAQCPLSPGTPFVITYEINVGTYHKLASYTTTFTIISNTDHPTVIGCTRVYVTPVQPRYVSDCIKYTVICFLLLTALINLVTIIYSTHQESANPFLFVASTICNGPLLRQMGATIRDIVGYLQFALFMGGLNLQYPGFYQPLISSIKWCALFITPPLFGTHYNPQKDSIYVTYNQVGLKSLVLYSINSSITDSYASFIVIFCLICGACLIIQQLLILVTYITSVLLKKETKYQENFDFKIIKNIYFMLGLLLLLFLRVFASPFLIMSVYLFSCAANSYPKSEGAINNIQSLLDLINYFNSEVPNTFATPSSYYASVLPAWVIVLAALLFSVYVLLYVFFIANYIFGKGRKKLYSSLREILIWGALYNHYSPSKVAFIVIDSFHLFFRCMVIGGLQVDGGIQICLLAIFEILYYIVYLFISPDFVSTTWFSSKVILGFARIVVIFLCVPYIRWFNVNEARRTYVAYVQLLVHVFVGLVFLFILMKSFISTLHEIYLDLQKNDKVDKEEMRMLAVPEDSTTDLYFRAKSQRLIPQEMSEQDEEKSQTSLSRPDFAHHNESRISTIQSQYDGLEDTERMLNPIAFSALPSTLDEPMVDFEKRREVDYTTREADKFYNRFSENVDPEVKELWDSRDMNGSKYQYYQANTNLSHSSLAKDSTPTSSVSKAAQWLSTKLRLKTGQQQPVTRKFEVARPRRLVVKTLAEVQQSSVISRSSSFDESKKRSEVDADDERSHSLKTPYDESFNFNSTTVGADSSLTHQRDSLISQSTTVGVRATKRMSLLGPNGLLGSNGPYTSVSETPDKEEETDTDDSLADFVSVELF